MLRFVSVLLLVACSSTPDALPDGQAAPPTPPTFTLRAGVACAGQDLSLLMFDAPADEPVDLLLGRAGAGPCVGGVCPALINAQPVGAAWLDNQGVAVATVTIPRRAAGTVYLQAVARGAQEVSDAIAIPVHPAGSPACRPAPVSTCLVVPGVADVRTQLVATHDLRAPGAVAPYEVRWQHQMGPLWSDIPGAVGPELGSCVDRYVPGDAYNCLVGSRVRAVCEDLATGARVSSATIEIR